jgi:hypothetical protein
MTRDVRQHVVWLQNAPPTRPASSPQPENLPPKEARCPNQLLGHLGHLRETNDLFGHLALIWPSCPSFVSPCPIAPPRQRNLKKTKRNLFCTTPLRSLQDLVRLLRFLRTFLQAAQLARRMSCLSILILRSSTKPALAARRSGRHKQGLEGGVVELDGPLPSLNSRPLLHG